MSGKHTVYVTGNQPCLSTCQVIITLCMLTDRWLSKLRHAAVSVVDSVGDNHGGAVSAETQSHLLHTSSE